MSVVKQAMTNNDETNNDELVRIAVQTAAEVCQLVDLEDEAKALLDAEAAPKQFLDRLIEQERFADATRFLAQALPKREAVWWACLSAQGVLGDEPAALEVAATDAAEAWVRKPIQENCHAAMAAAKASGFTSPAGWAAVAAFWSGETLASADLPAVPPAPGLVGKAVAGAVMLAAVSGEPTQAMDNYRALLERGIKIASGSTAR